MKAKYVSMVERTHGTAKRIRLKKCSIIHWHNLIEHPEDIPKFDKPCWYLVAVVRWNKEGTGVSWGSYNGYWNPEKQNWLRYDIRKGEYEPFSGNVVMWADFPLSFLEVEMVDKDKKEDAK